MRYQVSEFGIEDSPLNITLKSIEEIVELLNQYDSEIVEKRREIEKLKLDLEAERAVVMHKREELSSFRDRLIRVEESVIELRSELKRSAK